MLHYLALWLLTRIAGRLPHRVLTLLADGLGTIAWYASPRLRRVTTDHMRHVLGPWAALAVHDRHARGCVRAAARRYVDLARAPYLAPGDEWDPVESIDGAHHFFAAYDRGCGVIVVSAHLGRPEFFTRALGGLGLDLLVLTEPLHPQRVHDLVHAVRAAPGVRFLPGDLAGARAALTHLRAGGCLLALAERDVLHNGRPVTFFSERARLPSAPVELALRTGATIVPVSVLRTPHDRLCVTIDPPLALERTGDREADIDAGMRSLAVALEACIRRGPDQWFALSPVWSGLVHSQSCPDSGR